MYTLIIEDITGKTPPKEYSFEQGSYTIGRVEGNDIILPSSSVSRTHARIFVSNGRCYIDDLGSANGITIDGAPVTSRQEVQNNSKIRIGEFTLYLEQRQTVDGGQDVLRTQIVSSGQSGYKLVRVGDAFAGEEFALTEQVNTIGRTEDNYILLSDSSISRNHAQIHNSGITYKLVDLGSSNGTRVNGKPIKGEVLLQSDDEIKFGNISFVFVPASKHVDLKLYARQSRTDKKLIGILAACVGLLLVLIIVVVLVLTNNKEKKESEAQSLIEQQEAYAELQNKLKAAQTYIKEKHYSQAEPIVKELLSKWPDDANVHKLQEIIENENKYDSFIKEGDKLADAKEYQKAIEFYKQIPEDSGWYKRARKSIDEAQNMRNKEIYTSSKSDCTMAPAVSCIESMCEVALELKGSKINETKRFMESLVKTKGEVGEAAKRCLNDLDAM